MINANCRLNSLSFLLVSIQRDSVISAFFSVSKKHSLAMMAIIAIIASEKYD